MTLLLPARPVPLAAQASAEAPPNVLVFVGDDLGWRDTGPYGNTAIHTPNLDRLARSGLRVERAFGTSPQCSPSRISILTGKYAHSTRTEDLHTPLPETERILPSYLNERGWFTGHMAKTHYGPAAERQFRWYSPKTAEAFPDFLDAAGARSFFLWVGFHEPHRPYRHEAASEAHAPASVKVPPQLADTPETRADLARYYDAIARMDRGMALRALARAGRLSAAQRPLFQAPRPRIELYDLADDPWELHNVAGDPGYAKELRELAGVLQEWIEQSGDFPAAYRLRDDNTDRITGVQFSTRIPPMRNPDVPPPDKRWGRAGPS